MSDKPTDQELGEMLIFAKAGFEPNWAIHGGRIVAALMELQQLRAARSRLIDAVVDEYLQERGR